jgi:hypothetical protein
MRPPVEPSEAIAYILAEGPEHAGERMAAFILRTLESSDNRKWIVAMVRAATAEPEIAAVVRERFAETILIPLAEAIGSPDPEYRATLAPGRAGSAAGTVPVATERGAARATNVAAAAAATHAHAPDAGSPSRQRAGTSIAAARGESRQWCAARRRSQQQQ